MVTSITVRNRTADHGYEETRLTGAVTIAEGSNTELSRKSQTVKISADYTKDPAGVPGTLMGIWNDVKALAHFPYLTALVAPGAAPGYVTTMRKNDAWILNGNLTMATPGEDPHTLVYTDLGTRNLSDEDFQDMEDCCRILRSWLDMAKDNMLDTTLKWNPAPYQPNRPDCTHCNDTGTNNLSATCPTCTTASQKPLALYKQYKALVWLWNYLVGETAAQIKIANHPADPAALVVAVSVGLPSCWDNDTIGITKRLKVEIQADIESEQMPDLLFWVRRTMVASSPACTGIGNEPIQVSVERTSGTTGTLMLTSYLDLKPQSTYQTVSVFEIFPYYNDAESSSSSGESDKSVLGSETGYYNSRRNYNFDRQGSTTWSFILNAGYDDNLEASPAIIFREATAVTAFAAAPEPESSSR